MNTEGPTPLNYATPVKRVCLQWPWGIRFVVVALIAVLHFGPGFFVDVYDSPPKRYLAFVLYPGLWLIGRLRQSYLPDRLAIAVLVGESLLVGAILATVL